jgi:hypothetical protein
MVVRARRRSYDAQPEGHLVARINRTDTRIVPATATAAQKQIAVRFAGTFFLCFPAITPTSFLGAT